MTAMALIVCVGGILAGPAAIVGGPADLQALPQTRASRTDFRGSWWADEQLRRELQLSEEQTARIEAIVNATRPQLEKLVEELRQVERELEGAFAQEITDEVAVTNLIDRAEFARFQLSRTRTLMLFRMRLVLGPEQRALLGRVTARGRR